MAKYGELMARLSKKEKINASFDLPNKRTLYETFEDAALIKLDIQATIKRRITRFVVAGIIILIENSL